MASEKDTIFRAIQENGTENLDSVLEDIVGVVQEKMESGGISPEDIFAEAEAVMTNSEAQQMMEQFSSFASDENSEGAKIVKNIIGSNPALSGMMKQFSSMFGSDSSKK